MNLVIRNDLSDENTINFLPVQIVFTIVRRKFFLSLIISNLAFSSSLVQWLICLLVRKNGVIIFLIGVIQETKSF